MSSNRDYKIHVFTDQQLKEHDLNIAKTVHDATVKHTARKMVKMNSGQQLKSMTNGCRSLKLPDSILSKIAEEVLKAENVD